MTTLPRHGAGNGTATGQGENFGWPGLVASMRPRTKTSAPESAAAAQPGWRGQSACQSEDPELFFPLSPLGPGLAQLAVAKAVCGRCRVRAECLRFALSTGQEYGVWGGMSEEERTAMRRPPIARPPAARPPSKILVTDLMS